VSRLACGRTYHPSPVSRRLQALRWSLQTPARRARQRAEAAIARWRQGTWPALKRGRTPRGTPPLVVDDSGGYPVPSVVRTDAPGGHTPIRKAWWTREPLAAISAISPAGQRDGHGPEGAFNSAPVVAFLAHRLRAVPGPRGLIWAGAPIHRRRVLTECLANGAQQRLPAARLPAAAPDLNPGEGRWAQLHGVELRTVCGFSLASLRQELRDAVTRGRRKPRLIKGCFEGAKL
jgi:transposase